MSKAVSKTNGKPNEAVQRVGGASTGALLAIVIQDIAEIFGYSIPSDSAVAIGSLIGSFTTEVFRTINAYLNRGVETIPAGQVRTVKTFNPTAEAPAAAQLQEKPSAKDNS